MVDEKGWKRRSLLIPLGIVLGILIWCPVYNCDLKPFIRQVAYNRWVVKVLIWHWNNVSKTYAVALNFSCGPMDDWSTIIIIKSWERSWPAAMGGYRESSNCLNADVYLGEQRWRKMVALGGQKCLDQAPTMFWVGCSTPGHCHMEFLLLLIAIISEGGKLILFDRISNKIMLILHLALPEHHVPFGSSSLRQAFRTSAFSSTQPPSLPRLRRLCLWRILLHKRLCPSIRWFRAGQVAKCSDMFWCFLLNSYQHVIEFSEHWRNAMSVHVCMCTCMTHFPCIGCGWQSSLALSVPVHPIGVEIYWKKWGKGWQRTAFC